ncbi:leucine zipper domain-containing protein, partial [Pseudonocardia sp. D17]|uniref:leucine zipper domain-containing protein n=1 Tax=Pseudonocardia sp. D17 TaxID=882661 RepID=UPI00403F8155
MSACRRRPPESPRRRRGRDLPAGLHKWHTRWRAEGEAGLVERSSRPRRSPRRTPPELEARIER